MLALLGASLVGGSRLGTEFLPTLEENNYWIRVVLPNTVDLDYSVQISNRLRDFFRQQPEVANVVVQIGRPDDGTDSGGAFNQEYALYFKDPASWPAGSSKEGLRRRLEEYLNKIPGIDYNFSQYIQDNVAEALSGVKGANVVKLYGLDLDTLDDKAEEIQRVLKELPDVTDVGIFRELGQPTLNIQIDRAKCARFGLNVTDLQTLVQYAIGATPVTTVLEGEQRYDLVIRYPQQNRESADKIRGLLVDTPDGQRIPLGMVADVSLSGGPFFIYRENAKRYIAIKFSVNGRDLGGTVERAQRAVASQVQMESGYYMEWQGEFLQMKEAQRKLRWVIPLTLFGIFFMLYSAFGGAKDALIVLLNVPFSIIGGIAALYAAGETLSISAGIGFLSLFGIAILDGVILIACIRNLRAEGVKLAEAVMQGAMTRLRPVLMTASLAGLGLVPAALSHAIGSQAQKPLALVIVGGMASTTILTLLVLPVFYQWFYRRELNG
jgi:heavy metal efflux system protein